VKGLTKISKIFEISAPFDKLSSILRRTPNFCAGWPILHKFYACRILTSLAAVWIWSGWWRFSLLEY